MDIIQSSILRILHPTMGTTVGVAFVVTDTLVATCAHVLENIGLAPGDTVSLIFHRLNLPTQAHIEPEYWHDQAHEDVALLHLHNPLPAEIKILPLITSYDSINHHFQTFGFPHMKPTEGLIGTGTIDGQTTDHGVPIFQVTSEQITHGFSGAPLWDIELQGVVGMVNSIIGTDLHRAKDVAGHSFTVTFPADFAWRNQRTAFATTIETLCILCPRLSLSKPSLHQLSSTHIDPSAPQSLHHSHQDSPHILKNMHTNTNNNIIIHGDPHITYMSSPISPSQEQKKNRPIESVGLTPLLHLSLLLQQLHFSESDIQDAYNECVPEDLTGLNLWLFPHINERELLLQQIFMQLEEVPEARNGIPAILAFAEYLSLQPDNDKIDPSQKLKSWIDTYIHMYNIPSKKVATFQKRYKTAKGQITKKMPSPRDSKQKVSSVQYLLFPLCNHQHKHLVWRPYLLANSHFS